jgi:hypothetical protein
MSTSVHRRAWLAFASVGLGLVLVAGEARAQSTCFPPGGGVPGQPGVPDWWTSPAPFDDARWQGSYGFGKGEFMFNALVETTGSTKSLILKWHVKPDSGVAGPGDKVYVGFYNPGTTVATVFKFTRDALATTPLGGSPIGVGFMSTAIYQRTGTGLWSGGNGVDAGTTGVTYPSEVAGKARIDAVCGTADPILCDDWGLRLRIPTSGTGSLALPDTFQMWYEIVADHAGTSTQSKFPTGALEPDETADPLLFPVPEGSASPPSAAWNQVTIAGGSCVAGVELENDDISVTNALGTGTSIDVNSANTFDARPKNNTTTAYNPDSIKAHLRIADWGSAVGDSPRWITVPDPSCEAAIGTGAVASITGGTRFDLKCAWTLTAGQKCAYRPDLFPGCTPDPGPRYKHQCILTELQSNGAPIPFSKSSAWNNFDFDHSSRLERRARLDIGAMTPRDVYVYVTAGNMPDTVTSDAPPPQTERGAVLLQKAGGGIVPGRVSAEQAKRLQTLAASGQLSYDEVAKIMPTFSAYVWHDTGTTIRSPSGPSKLLEAQPSFTLFVSHDGPLYGWKHALQAVAGGATITEISKNYFRIGVGPSGSVEVATVIEALEQPGGGGGTVGWPSWMLPFLIIIGLLFLVALIRLLRRLGSAAP